MSEQEPKQESANWGFVVVFGILIAGVVVTVYIITNAIVRTSC